MLALCASRVALEEWLYNLKLADWNIADDIKDTFATADFLGRGTSRVIFNIDGNKYRLIAKYGFGDASVHLFICWLGTHAQYGQLCAERKQYSINVY